MPQRNSVSFAAHNPHTRMDEPVRRMLHLFTGRGRAWTIKDLAIASGVGADRIEKAKLPADNDSYRRLDFDSVGSIVRVIGTGAFAIVAEALGFGVYDLPDPDDDGGLHDMAPDAVEDAAQLTKAALSAGNVTDIRSIGHRSITRGHKLVALATAGQGDFWARRA